MHKHLRLTCYALLCLLVPIGVSTFPNTFALVLDSNLHDLNGTNPD